MKATEKVPTITIFSQRLAGYLMLNGFVLADMRSDRDGSGRNLFFFKDTDELRKRIEKFGNYKK